jgi:putative membrane protein
VLRKDKEAEAERAAAIVFDSQRLHSTRQAGGVLIYVSLFERKVIVLADDGAMKALDQSTLDAICTAAVKNIQANKRSATFLEAIETLEPLLAKELPIGDGDVDELPNRLVCIHPRP